MRLYAVGYSHQNGSCTSAIGGRTLNSRSDAIHSTTGTRVPSWLSLIVWIAVCVGGGALVGVLTNGGDSAWYRSLNKPTWNPPSWVFAPVWTMLYLLMAIAVWLVSRYYDVHRRSRAVTIFVVQLVLNFLWSFLFFSLHSPTLALVDILALWLAILVTMREFSRVDARAAWLLAPYVLWVSFASILNAAIVGLN
jgi:tryptophan-rich sensory protein